MAKDPAFLFYSSDFLIGTSDLTMEERGQYITLLCLQHQKGSLSERTISLNLGSVSVHVIEKFLKDNDGNFFNKRLNEEIEKRSNFVESRRTNGSKGGRSKNTDNHKVNLIDNENVIVNVIESLNKSAGVSFRTGAEKNTKPIKARINEGFVIQDFYDVINHKVQTWGTDSKMKEYLRPETLFGNKFEGYLQAARNKTSPGQSIQQASMQVLGEIIQEHKQNE